MDPTMPLNRYFVVLLLIFKALFVPHTILEAVIESPPKLILNFDLNGTLILKDTAFGKTAEEMLDKLLLNQEGFSVDEKMMIRQQIIDKFTNQESGEVHFSVFPSFYVMLDRLREQEIPFIIVFRTFDPDCYPNLL